jgi:hypothetical protein
VGQDFTYTGTSNVPVARRRGWVFFRHVGIDIAITIAWA